MVPTRATAADVPAVMLLIGRVFSEYGLLLMPTFEVPDLLQFIALRARLEDLGEPTVHIAQTPVGAPHEHLTTL